MECRVGAERDRGSAAHWALVLLALALLVGAALTWWAGRSGTLRSRHGVLGRVEPAAPFLPHRAGAKGSTFR
ncbi:MAG: hypothetical protein Kow0092_05170 [Deferrisomatales bacterium]